MRGFIVTLALLCACGGDDAAYETQRAAAIALSEAFCAQLVRCGEIPSSEETNCIDAIVAEYCQVQGADCTQPPEGSDSDIDACIDAVDEQVCGAPNAPAVCNDVL